MGISEIVFLVYWCMQDFVNQAESLIHEDGLRETLIDNAKTFIETEYNETVEHEEYAKLATEMCKGYITKREEVTENAEDQVDTVVEHKPKVRFQIDEKRKGKTAAKGDVGCEKAPDATEVVSGNEDQSTTSEEPNQVVENETSHKELEDNANTSQPVVFVSVNVIPPDEEEKPKPSQVQVVSKPDSAAEKDGKQTASTDGGEDRVTEKTDNVEDTSVKLRTNHPPDTTSASLPSPRIAAMKTDKRNTDTSSPPPKTSPQAAPAGKGGGTAAKNGPRQPAMSVMSDSAKKTVSITSKKVPLQSTTSADKSAGKQLSAHRPARKTASDADVTRRQKIKK